MAFLKEHDIQTTFHYLPLHSSAYYKDQFRGEPLVHCDHYGDCLVRLPLYYELSDEDATRVAQLVLEGITTLTSNL
jgi:dTDP-4-amino-4,6-dideoxygalactose transaminase